MKKTFKVFVILILLLNLTGCAKPLRDSNNKAVSNKETGQNLTENILCKPKSKVTIKEYKKNKVNLEKLPDCDNYKVMANGYESLWTSFFVQPLAWVILKLGILVKSKGLSLIIISIIIRMLLFPFTKKMAIQSEQLKKAQKDMKKIEKKYENKTDQESMIKKSQEMTMVYKKYGINPASSCLIPIIQIPLLFAFFEAINRTPAIFEEKFMFLHLGTTPIVGIPQGNISYIILIILIGLTTYYSFKFNQQDTQQVPGMQNMPIMMTGMIIFMGLFMSSALGIYWITTNLFTIVQNILVKRSKNEYGKV